MKSATSLLIMSAAFAASVNLNAEPTYLYTFYFLEDRSWPETAIWYSATQLPASGEVLGLDYLTGDVNGCAPPVIQATVQDGNEVLFGPSGDVSPSCDGNPSGVIGFSFAVQSAFYTGGYYSATGGGRVVKNDADGHDIYYAGGSLTIQERPPASPVPEPSAALLVGPALLLLPLLRTRIA